VSFEKIRQYVERIYEDDYRVVVESGIYRNPLNYYLVCSYPVKPSGDVCEPSKMFTGFEGEIALYFHIPFCVTRCTFCNFHLHTGAEMSRAGQNNLVNAYLSALDKESALVVRALQEGHSKFTIHSIYVGGGTPTYLNEEQLRTLVEDVIMKNFSKYFRSCGLVEFTVEASPGTVSKSKLELLKKLGVTRLSIGVQTFDDQTLKLMARDHDKGKALIAIEMAREVFADRFNVDIIVGFPVDTRGRGPRSAFERLYCDLTTILELELPSVTFYHLWTRGMDATAMMKNVQNGKWVLPSQEEVIKCWLLINLMLNKEFNASNPYHQNPAGWFIRKDSALFKQQIFKWSEKHQYLGIGVSAYDYFNGYATHSIVGNNIQGTLDYIERVSNHQFPYEEVRKMDDDEIDRLKAVFAIKTRDGLDLNQLRDPKRFESEIDILKELGLVTLNGTNVRLTPKGFVFFDEVSEFFFKPEERTKIGKPSDIVSSIPRNRVNYFIRKAIRDGEIHLKTCKSEMLRDEFDSFLKELYRTISQPFDFFIRTIVGNKYLRSLFVYLYYEIGTRPHFLTPYYTKDVSHLYRDILLPWFKNKVSANQAVSLTEVIFSPPDENTMYFPPPISFSLVPPSQVCSAVNIIPVGEVRTAILRAIGGAWSSVSECFQDCYSSGSLNLSFLDSLWDSLRNDGAIETVKNRLLAVLGSRYPSKTDALQNVLSDPHKLWPSFIIFFGNDDIKTNHYLFIPLDVNERCLPIGLVLELSDMLNDDEYHKVFQACVSTLPIISKFQERIKSYVKHQESIEHALRSAVAAIMARNMSHNPGSHGLAHLIGGTLSPSDQEVKAFLEYIKSRMDFLAEVTTYWREMPWLQQLTL
jgi:oxygen-independent coproporphyrinogen-3 oxidase